MSENQYKVRAGGAALPTGIMMAAGNRGGVATTDAAGIVRSASFQAIQNKWKKKGLRGIGSIGASMGNTAKAMGILCRLRKQGGMLESDLLKLTGYLAASAGYWAGCSCLKRKLGDQGELTELFGAMLYVLLFWLSPAGKKVRTLHGAEHQTVHCTDEGKAPVPENACTKSPIHPRCGTSLATGVTALYGVSAGVILPWLKGVVQEAADLGLLLAAFGISYEALISSKDNQIKKLGRMFQRLTTAPADEESLEIASAALFAAIAPDGRE